MNHLAHETSPYLLLYKNSPVVDSYPWGLEALQKAAEEDKVILLRIGYSACDLPVKTVQEALKLLK
jgi:uncharacterized protein YyaL (SSP411 family)